MARILVVDDQDHILVMVKSLLKTRKHTVETASNPHDAIDLLKRFPFDLLITDIQMPGASGLDLARTVRHNREFAHLAIMILSGKRRHKDVHDGISVGADEYVVKPIDPDVFLAKVDALLAKHGQVAKVAAVKVRQNASWDLKCEVTEVSEMGLTVMSTYSPVIGSKTKLQSPLFDMIGIKPPWLVVVDCKLFPNGYYEVQMNFAAMSESDFQPIRAWVRKAA